MKASLFFDRRPARDEYVGEAIGIFVGSYLVCGFWFARRARQFGIVILNHALGVWIEEEQ